MYLKCSVRRKDGKTHRSWAIVESRREPGGGTVQRHLLYLGEINDSQQAAWQKSIAVFSDDEPDPRQMALFPEDRVGAAGDVPHVQLRLSALSLHRPRQWGACWLALELWRELRLDLSWREKLPPSREGTRWDLVLTALAIYRWLSPGSEWRLHREWFVRSALGDLLASDLRLAADVTLYRCLAFLAYALQVTLGRRLHALAPGLTPRGVLEKFAAITMLDVHLPTTDGRLLQLTRYTQPERETQILLEKLKLQLPPQPPPKITTPAPAAEAN
jgi:hypothetical protein